MWHKWCTRIMFLLLWNVLVTIQTELSLTYECASDGSVTVENPDTNIYLSATAGSGQTVCDVTLSDDKTEIYIAGCPKDAEILLTLSNRQSSGGGVVGGGGVSEYTTILCEEISDEGIIFETGLELAVPNVIASTTKAPQTGPTTTVTPQPPVTPTFILTSSLWDSSMTLEVFVASLGDEIVWKIQGPDQYDLLPYNCVGYGGKEVGGANSVQLTDESGCTTSNQIFQTFSAVGGSRSTVKTTLLAFKFIGHDDVTLACSVRICKAGSATCALNCNSLRRRRRRRHSRRRSLQPLRRASVVSHLRIVPSSAMRFEFSAALVTLACLLSRHAFV